LPGEDTWKEGKLVLENGSLCLRSNEQSKRSRIPFSFLKKNEETGFFIPIRSIRDVIREERGILSMKHTGNATLPAQAQEPGSESELLLSTQLAADEQVLNEVERELIMSMDAYKFNVYFTHAGEGGVLSMEKNVELEKGLLKISNNALWIIGRDSHKRITWDDIVNVEQKKRSRYKGTEFGAVSIDYFGAGSTNPSVISTIVITKGNTIEVLKRHVQELLNAYKMDEKLPDMENQILTMMYAGALDLSALASTAEAFGLSEEELKNQLEHLSELGIIDAANQTLTKKGIKYVMDLSKNGTFGG
jgi:helix-turn-helix protein